MTRLLALVAVVGSGVAAAQGVRFPRQQPPPPPARPLAATAPMAAPAPPPIDLEPMLGIAGLRNIRPEQEKILEALINDTPDTEVEEKSDYYFRLAQVYGALSLKWQLSDANKSKGYFLKAVKAYKELVDNERFRNYPKLDLALAYYAFVLQHAKYLKESHAIYQRILKDFPTSKYVADAFVMSGEQFSAQGQLAEAAAAYKRALELPKADIYPYAMMRFGWTQLALGRARETIDAEFLAVQLCTTPALAEVRRAAEMGYATAYAEVGQPEKSREAFTRVDKTAVAEMQGWLDARYQQIGKPAVGDCKAAVAAARAAPDRASAVERLVQACPNDGPQLADELGRAAHAEFARTRALDPLISAERLYRIYLDIAAGAPDLPEVRGAYAEVLWSHAELQPAPERWSAAAAAFVATGKEDVAMLAWKNGFVADAADLDAAARDRKKPREVPAGEASVLAVLAAGDAEAHLLAASRYRFYAQPDRAVGLLAWIVDNAPLDPTAEQASVLLLDSLVRAQQYDAALAWVDRFAADKRFVGTKPALQAAIQLMRSRSFRRQP